MVVVFEDVAPSPKPRVSPAAIGVLTAIIAAICMAVRLWWVEPMPAPVQPKEWMALPFAVAFGFGVAVVLSLAWANRHRWRVVLYPNRGRVIGAYALACVTPFAVFDWLPAILGGWVLIFGLSDLSGGNPLTLIFGLVAMLLPALLWYPVSCLIVSGLKSRWVRVAVYSLMFWTAYSAIILMFGTQRFTL